MNGFHWRVIDVPPNSDVLIDRTGIRTVATTDPRTGCVYLNEDLYGPFKQRVLIHELGHCAMISYNLIDDIHSIVNPENWIEVEEWVCNFIADYGWKIFRSAYSILGNDAMRVVPYEINRIIA